MDGGGSLNLLYQDKVHKMGIDPSRIKPTKTTFKGVIPGVEACALHGTPRVGVDGAGSGHRARFFHGLLDVVGRR